MTPHPIDLTHLSPPPACLAFMASVAAAVYAQNLTGFALVLILLGIVSITDVVPIADASNAAMMLLLANAWSFLRTHRVQPPWRLMMPALAASVPGVLLGVALLAHLTTGAVHWLGLTLGISIVVCACLLLVQAQPRTTISGAPGFAAAGLVSGVLSGLFSTPGPPLVYHLYRQPLDADTIRTTLLSFFAVGAAVRLVAVLWTGQFNANSALLSACTIPVVAIVTRWQGSHQAPVSASALRWLVAVMLIASGAMLIVRNL